MVTVSDVRNSYLNKQPPQTVTLADQYLLTDPNNITVRTYRYWALTAIGRYADALAEVDRIAAIQGANLQKSIACDGVALAKLVQDTTEQQKYSPTCQ